MSNYFLFYCSSKIRACLVIKHQYRAGGGDGVSPVVTNQPLLKHRYRDGGGYGTGRQLQTSPSFPGQLSGLTRAYFLVNFPGSTMVSFKLQAGETKRCGLNTAWLI